MRYFSFLKIIFLAGSLAVLFLSGPAYGGTKGKSRSSRTMVTIKTIYYPSKIISIGECVVPIDA